MIYFIANNNAKQTCKLELLAVNHNNNSTQQENLTPAQNEQIILPLCSQTLSFSTTRLNYSLIQYLQQFLDIDGNYQNLLKLNIAIVGSSFLIRLFFEKANTYFKLMAQNGDVLMTGVMPLQFMRKLCSISAQDAAIIIYIAIICTINYLGAILIAINSI